MARARSTVRIKPSSAAAQFARRPANTPPITSKTATEDTTKNTKNLPVSALLNFAADLRLLRQKAGNPTYRELAKRAHFSVTTLSSAANGRQLPSLTVTLAYVRACDGDEQEWEQRWHSVATELAVAGPIIHCSPRLTSRNKSL